MTKQNRNYLRYFRYAVQWAIFLFLIYAGYRFYFFVEHFLNHEAAVPGAAYQISANRLPSIEGFLPIGALMSLKLWIADGIFDSSHPAALVIFIAALLLAIIFKKGFCGWICPVGTLSDSVWKLGKRIFGRDFVVPRYADYGIRSVKYILMAFFLYVVAIKMPAPAILGFIEGDYYKIADVKMLFFFTKMTVATAVSLGLLFVLSLFYKNFWCRYLCPYGALLGLVSFLSPMKITRNDEACIHCSRCTKNCPSQLPVEQLERVKSPECTGCLTCVSHCPAKGALDVSLPAKKTVNPLVFACLIVAVFFGSIGIAKLSGKWHSAVTYEEYQRIVPLAEHLDHP